LVVVLGQRSGLVPGCQILGLAVGVNSGLLLSRFVVCLG